MSFFIFCILPRLPCFRTFPASARTCLPLTFRPFQNRPFPKQGNSSIPLFSRNFFIFQSICFTNSSAKCLAIRTLLGGLPWVSPPSFTMFLTTTSSIPFFQAIPRMVPLTLMSVSLKSLLMTAQKNISLPTFSIRSSHRQCFRNFIFIAGRLCRYRHMGIEISFRYLKHAAGLLYFHSKQPEFLKQEIYSRLILYNFGIFIANEAAEENRKKKRDGSNKYLYELDFSSALKTARKFFMRRDSGRHIDIIRLMMKYVHAVKDRFRQFQRPLRGISAIHFGYR